MPEIDKHIVTLAKMMIERKKAKEPPYTLLLGAGASVKSGLFNWVELCDGLSAVLGADSQEELYNKLSGVSRNSPGFYATMKGFLGGKEASKGYHYLAYLIAQGYIDIVFSTNWDSFLEDVLPLQLKYSDFKVLIRGELTDKKILAFMDYPSPRVKIVKLHGDLGSRVFEITNKDLFAISDEIKEFLKGQFSKDVIIVGHSVNDNDIQTALNSRSGSIWYVSREKPSARDFILKAMDARGCIDQLILSSFDNFFINLTKKIGQEQLTQKNLPIDIPSKRIVSELIEKGTNYLDIHWVEESVVELCAVIRRKFRPDLIIYIHDSEAPGGSEVKKWIERKKCFAGIRTQVIEIEGRKENLVHRRVKNKFKKESGDVSKVLIVDNIAFSGRTALLAAKQIKKAYGEVPIKMGFLVVGKPFLAKLDAGKIEGLTRDDVFFIKDTDRAEIFFPWGYTESTENTAREVCISNKTYFVQCYKRPWGSVEVFSENEFCSVNLLTVNAGHCLSLQRHICRDEFFIPLDDNIGLQIEEERFVIEKGDYVVIPRGVWHRVFAYKTSGRVLEIGFGYYDQIHDIERREDRYDRVNKDGSY